MYTSKTSAGEYSRVRMIWEHSDVRHHLRLAASVQPDEEADADEDIGVAVYDVTDSDSGDSIGTFSAEIITPLIDALLTPLEDDIVLRQTTTRPVKFRAAPY